MALLLTVKLWLGVEILKDQMPSWLLTTHVQASTELSQLNSREIRENKHRAIRAIVLRKGRAWDSKRQLSVPLRTSALKPPLSIGHTGTANHQAQLALAKELAT